MGLSFLLAVQQKRMKRRWRGRRRRRETQNSKTWVAPVIPLDLLIEILARLPAKSVMRFKCVSKFWSSLFRSKNFYNRFLMFPSPNQPRLYMSLLDRRHYSKSLLLSSSPTPTTCEFDQDLTIRKMGGYGMRVLRGFICFVVDSKARIYNPSTRQLVILPAIKSNILAQDRNFHYFIGHDPVSNQYKLLCTITAMSENMLKISSERWVFVLEAGGLWKRVAKDFLPHLPEYLELIMNGVLYYLAYTDLHTCVLVSFDFSSEKFDMIQVPRKACEVLIRDDQRDIQIEYGGKVAVFDMTYLKVNGTVDLWILEDWKNNDWSMKTLVVKPSQMNLVIGINFMPKGTNRKGQVILAPLWLTSSPFYFLYYDLQTNDLQKVEIKGIPDRWFSKPETPTCYDMRFMDPSEGIEYLET